MCACGGRRGGRERLRHSPGRQYTNGGLPFGGVLKTGILREHFNRIFISFIPMHLHEIYALNFICPWVCLENGTNWNSVIYLSP